MDIDPAATNGSEELDSLKRTMRDVVALSTLPAIWNGLAPEGVIASLSSVLASTLDLDLAYITLCADGAAAEAMAGRQRDTAARLLAPARALADQAATTSEMASSLTLADPADGRALRACVLPLGIGKRAGTMVMACARPGFPSEHERLLLGVGANQAAVVLQRQLAEQAFRRSEQRFIEFADAAPAMLWVTEADGACSFLSRGWYAFTGQTEDAGLGFGWTLAIHPDDRQAASRAFLEANEQKKGFSLEHRLLHADGTYRWVIDLGRPRLSPGGDFLGFVGNVFDISDRKRAERALHETQGLLSTVFEALPVGIAVVGQDGRLRLSNREMHQYLPTGIMPSLDDARHQRWRAVDAAGEPLAREDFAGARALRGERVVPGIETLYTKDDGSEIWTQVAAVPLADPDGQPNGQVTIVTNIDAFKRTEAALRQSDASQRALFDEVTRSNKNLSEFLAVLAHELRNPLAPIITGLEVMRIRADSKDTVARVREVIERQAGQLSHLIDDLLDIARVTNGKVEIRKQAHDLRDIAANAVETSLPLIEKDRHAFSLALPDAPLPVSADATRIAQVISNLLTNAAKYTPPGGQIRLVVERAGDQAVLSVIDNGLGIPPESLESVFDMFSQVGRNMNHAQGGLGIGLSLVRQLVALHGGTVLAHSAGTGRGSTFTVRLPLDPDSMPAIAAEGAAALAAPGRSLRILVTDDNIDAAMTLASLLGMHGHLLSVVHTGQQALRMAEQFRPDVALLDIGLPDMSGYDVARRLRQVAGLERCTVVAVSGWGAPDDLARSHAAGFDRHFTKPVAPAQLLEFLKSLP